MKSGISVNITVSLGGLALTAAAIGAGVALALMTIRPRKASKPAPKPAPVQVKRPTPEAAAQPMASRPTSKWTPRERPPRETHEEALAKAKREGIEAAQATYAAYQARVSPQPEKPVTEVIYDQR